MKTDWAKSKAENFSTAPPQRNVSRSIDGQKRSYRRWIPSRGEADDGYFDRNMDQPTSHPILPADLAVIVDRARDDEVRASLLSHGLTLSIGEWRSVGCDVGQESPCL